jgi:hypothetical protein
MAGVRYVSSQSPYKFPFPLHSHLEIMKEITKASHDLAARKPFSKQRCIPFQSQQRQSPVMRHSDSSILNAEREPSYRDTKRLRSAAEPIYVP